MKEIILAKYGEIILKGGNRPRFESILINNINNATKNITCLRFGSSGESVQFTAYVSSVIVCIIYHFALPIALKSCRNVRL